MSCTQNNENEKALRGDANTARCSKAEPKNFAQPQTPFPPASVAQWAEAQCAPTGTVSRRSRGSIPGRPVDFVFGFQGRML